MPAPPSEGRFSTLLDNYCSWLSHNRGKSDATVDKYRGYLTRLATWCADPETDPSCRASTTDPTLLTLDDLRRFSGMWAHKQGLTPRARRPLVAALRGFWAFAFGKDSVAGTLEYPSCGRPLPRSASLSHASRLLMQPDIETFLGLRDAAMIALLIGCGLRISGLVAMDEEHLVWSHDEHGSERLTIRVTEKGKRERQMPVPIEAALLIRAYIGHPDLAAIDRSRPNGHRVLWVSTRNQRVPVWDYIGEARRLSTRTVRQMIDRYGRRAGVPAGQRHPHALRHLYGTELAEADVDLIQRQALLGHARPETTEIYTHLATRKLQRTVDRANPLGKIQTPLLDQLRELEAATKRRTRASVRPDGA